MEVELKVPRVVFRVAELTALAALVAAACRSAGQDGGDQEYRGRYTFGFEVGGFVPCGSRQAWWVDGDLGGIQALTDTAQQFAPRPETFSMRSGTVYARVRGVLSDSGAYGHLSAYGRKLRVNAVLDVRMDAPADCE